MIALCIYLAAGLAFYLFVERKPKIIGAIVTMVIWLPATVLIFTLAGWLMRHQDDADFEIAAR